jgi:hypothetical protein
MNKGESGKSGIRTPTKYLQVGGQEVAGLDPKCSAAGKRRVRFNTPLTAVLVMSALLVISLKLLNQLSEYP